MKPLRWKRNKKTYLATEVTMQLKTDGGITRYKRLGFVGKHTEVIMTKKKTALESKKDY